MIIGRENQVRILVWPLSAVLISATAVSAQPRFQFASLPQLPGGESVAHSLMGEVTDTLACGHAEDESGVKQPVVWDATGPGPAFLDELPVTVPDYVSCDAKVLSRGPSGNDYAGGCVVDSSGVVHPMVWTRMANENDWNGEEIFFIPSEGMYEPYIVPTIPPLGGPETGLSTVGTHQTAGFPRKATLVTKDFGTGDWTLTPVPDSGASFASQAEAMVVIQATGLRTIVGAVQTISASLVPCAWQETSPGLFTRLDLPLSPGAYFGALTDVVLEEDGQTLVAVGYNAIPGGFDFYRPVIHRRVNGVWSQPLVLQPLPGLRDARPGGVLARTPLSLDSLTVVGYSYFEPGQSGHRATLWEIDPDDDVLAFDLNDVLELPPVGVVLERAEGVQWTGSPRMLMVAGVFTVAAQTAGPATTSHAFVLTSLSATIPAVSTWGMVVACLTLLVAASMVIRARTLQANSCKFLTVMISQRAVPQPLGEA